MGLVARFPLPASLGGPTPPSLEDWEFQYNGLALGPGTSYGITKITGLNLANIRAGDQALPRDDGEIPGLDLYSGRDVELDLWMTGTGGLQANQLALATAMRVGYATEQPLWFQLPTIGLLCVMARTRKRDMPWDATYAAQAKGEPTVQFHCTDPRIYAPGSATTLTLSESSGGLGFPVGPFPVTFGYTSSAAATITNAGNCETRPIVIFNGPSTNPWIANNTTDGTLAFQDPGQSGYTIAAGDQLVIDLGQPHRVLYYTGGISAGLTPSPVRDWLQQQTSAWWRLQPGANLIQYGTADTALTGLGTAEIVWASAYQL